MTNYARLSQKSKQFLALTGYTLEEFDALLPAFRNAFLMHMQTYTLEGKKRQKRSYVVYCNCPLPTIEDKLLFILMYLRKATTQDIFGEVFGMPQPVANKWIHVLHPCLQKALTVLGAIPARTAEELKLQISEQHKSISKMARSEPFHAPEIKKSSVSITVAREKVIQSRML